LQARLTSESLVLVELHPVAKTGERFLWSLHIEKQNKMTSFLPSSDRPVRLCEENRNQSYDRELQRLR
jgi:hypothetical protein